MTNLPRFSRRGFMAITASISVTVSAFAQTPLRPANPLVGQRADAQIMQHDDGYYYFTATVPEYDRLIVRRSRTFRHLKVTPEFKLKWFVWL